MLKRRLIPLLIALVPPFVVLAVLLAQRSIPAAEASDLYRRYEHSEHISATFIKDFPIDDTLRLDVTLLQATDSAGWEALQKEFNLVAVPPEIMATFDTNSIFTKYVPQRDHSQPMDSIILNNDILAYSYHRKEMTLFHLTTEQQAVAIMEYNAKETSKKTPLIF